MFEKYDLSWYSKSTKLKMVFKLTKVKVNKILNQQTLMKFKVLKKNMKLTSENCFENNMSKNP